MPRTQKRGRGRPRKKTIATPRTRSKATTVLSRPNFLSIRWTESYTSLLMGVVVVIIAVLFVVSAFKQTHHTQQTSSIATSAVPTAVAQKPTSNSFPTQTPFEGKNTYTVKAGDDLWHIAEKYYKSGYNWVDIARANNLANPGTIHTGNVLVIPRVTPEVETVSPTPTVPQTAQKVQQGNVTIGNSYTVKAGDDLWSIAVRAYNNGYKWVDIAKANHLSNPGLIYSGNVLTIPR